MTDFPAQITRIGNAGQHKMCRIWMEIPQDRAMAFIARFGWATEEKPIPVTISPQEGEAKRESTSHEKVLDSLEIVPPVEVHNNYPRRAGILSSNKGFWTFIEAPGFDKGTFARHYIKNQLGVERFRDIKPGTEAAALFDSLELKFKLWENRPRYVETA